MWLVDLTVQVYPPCHYLDPQDPTPTLGQSTGKPRRGGTGFDSSLDYYVGSRTRYNTSSLICLLTVKVTMMKCGINN